MYLAILLIFLAKVPYTKAYIPATIYAVAKFLMLSFFHLGLVAVLFSTLIGFVAAFCYFVFLKNLEQSIFAWFFVAIGGAILVTVI